MGAGAQRLGPLSADFLGTSALEVEHLGLELVHSIWDAGSQVAQSIVPSTACSLHSPHWFLILEQSLRICIPNKMLLQLLLVQGLPLKKHCHS